MSVYFVEKKGWRYDFMFQGKRYTKAWFQTKRDARQAEEEYRKLLKRPTPTDMAFLTLVNKRLDEVKQRLSHQHYMDTVYHARRWIHEWSDLMCSQISSDMVTELRDTRSRVSNQTANKELRYLRSLFNWGIKKEYINDNPASRVDKMRVEQKSIYVPSQNDVKKIMAIATPEQHDYILTLRDTLARSNEVNNLRWEDVDFENKTVTLHTRKKKNGTKTPRIIPMTESLFKVLCHRYKSRDILVEWVFWHKYYSKKNGGIIIGPYNDRKKFMKTLCQKAEVPYFRFHPIRHAGASFMENIGIPISNIQEILGHENRKTTEGYIHSNSTHKKDTMLLFELKMAQNTPNHTNRSNNLVGKK